MFAASNLLQHESGLVTVTVMGIWLANMRGVAHKGSGGMSIVYLAEHEQLKRKAALKVLSTDLAEDPALPPRIAR